MDGEKCHIQSYGCTEYLYITKYGLTTDGEAPKKSLTDAVKKALSLLGFSADVFLGLYDDQAYRNEVKQEFALKNASDKAEDIAAARTEFDEKLSKNATSIEKAVTTNEAEKIFKTVAREIDIHRKDAEAKGDQERAKYLAGRLRRLSEIKTIQDKSSMAATMRSVLSDVFREAVVEGHVVSNPVSPTRAAKVTVKRERLELEQYRAIRRAADTLPRWFSLAMDLALATGQRREDVAMLRFDHIVNGRLQIEQGKTGAMLSIPLELELKAAGLKLGEIVEQCRQASTTNFMVSAGIRKNSQDGYLHPDSLTKKFVAARKASGLVFEENAPTFHEIRSLAGRLYEKEKGKDFARRLLGHKSEKMTDKYLDTRGKEYEML